MEHFAWPLAVVFIAIATLLIFRTAFTRLIDRTSKATKEGVSFERPQEGSGEQVVSLPFAEVMKQPIFASVLERERYIKTNLEEFKLKTDMEKIDLLIRAVADSRIELEFNKIAYYIFGSQISLLNRLSGTTQGISLDNAEIIFIEAQNNYPSTHAERTFQTWLNYLLSYALITQNAEKINITQYGKDFLKHLIDTNQAYERHG